MNTLLKLKEKMSRVKVTEIKINSDGILVTCIPFKDYEIKEEAPTIELNSNVKEKQAFPLHNELNRIFSLINIIKIYLGYDKISAFDFSSINLPFMDQIQKQTISNEKIDEILGKILCEMEKTAKYLKDDFSLTSQVFIESRSLVMRVLFVRRKLEKIWESLEIVNRNFKMVEDNLKKIELLNKARMCLDLISYTSEKKPQDPQASSYQPPTPLWKKYMDNLNLIEDPVSKEKIRKEIERFQLLERNSGEYHKISTYLDEIFSVPWGKFSQPYWNVKSTSDILENNIYGLEKVYFKKDNFYI